MSTNGNYQLGLVHFLEHEQDTCVREIFLTKHWTHLELTPSGGYRKASYDPGDGVYIELPELTDDEIALVNLSPATLFRDFPFFDRLVDEVWQEWNALPSDLFDEEEE